MTSLHKFAVLTASLLLSGTLVPDAYAEPPIRIQIQPFEGSSGKTAAAVIRHDLEDSGYFQVIDFPATEPTFTVSGKSSGGRVFGELSSPGQAVLLDEDYQSPEIALNCHFFVDDIVQSITGNEGIAASTIAFVSNVSGLPQIYLCRYDGTTVQQITRAESPCVAPSLHPGGNSIAYSSYSTGFPDIHSLDLISGEHRQVVTAPGTCGSTAISPDGSQVALIMSYNGNPELYVASIFGGRPVQLTKSIGIESDPSWSPDGKRIVFSYDEGRGSKLKIVSASTPGKTQTVSTGTGNAMAPDWSPAGDRIAFTKLSGGRTEVAVYNLKTTQTETIAARGGHSPSWSPGGDHLVFSRGGELCTYAFPDSKERTILRNLGVLSEPDWSR